MQNENKINLLFLVSEFWQAGTQRFTFEVDRALNKTKFKTTILSLRSLNSNKGWADYYYEKHKELGSEIYFLKDLTLSGNNGFNEIKRRIGLVKSGKQEDPLKEFLKKFDAISVMGEYNYPYVKNRLVGKDMQKCLIHIMNSIYQNKDLYALFEKSRCLNFSSGFTPEEINNELSEIDNFNHLFFPLSINVDEKEVSWSYNKRNHKKIGIFTRLTNHKPLDQFFYAFHLLLESNPELELNVYGSGNPEEEGMMRYVRQLNIENKVFFRGHQPNLKRTALKDQLDMVWFHGYYGVPGGFAGFDICTLGIPQIFWDFSNNIKVNQGGTFPMINKLSLFVEMSKKVLENREFAENLSSNQFQNISTQRNIKNHIRLLENYYQSVCDSGPHTTE